MMMADTQRNLQQARRAAAEAKRDRGWSARPEEGDERMDEEGYERSGKSFPSNMYILLEGQGPSGFLEEVPWVMVAATPRESTRVGSRISYVAGIDLEYEKQVTHAGDVHEISPNLNEQLVHAVERMSSDMGRSGCLRELSKGVANMT